MTVTKHDLTIPQGSTYVLVVTVVGGPEDLAGYTADMQVRQSKAAVEVLADITTDNFTVEDSTRQIVLELTDEETMAYDWARPAVYDLYIESPVGERWRVVEGVAHLSKSVTREA